MSGSPGHASIPGPEIPSRWSGVLPDRPLNGNRASDHHLSVAPPSVCHERGPPPQRLLCHRRSRCPCQTGTGAHIQFLKWRGHTPLPIRTAVSVLGLGRDCRQTGLGRLNLQPAHLKDRSLRTADGCGRRTTDSSVAWVSRVRSGPTAPHGLCGRHRWVWPLDLGIAGL